MAAINLQTMIRPAPVIARGGETNNELLKFLVHRFQKALAEYLPSLPEKNRFMCVEYPDRCLFIINLALVGGFVSPKFASLVQREMENRRMIHREYQQFKVAVFQIAYAINHNDFQVMPGFDGRQVVIYGGTGGGKSTTIKHLLAGRQGIIVVIDPHYQRGAGQWNSRWLIGGAGGRFDEIERIIEIVHAETIRRIRSAAPQESHHPLHVAIDEMSNLIGDISDETIRKIYEIVRQGRKYNIFMVLTPHSVEVRAMGLEGAGGMRDSFLFVRMPRIRPGEEHKPRIVDVFLGNPLKSTAPDGRYLIPPPTIYQGEPQLVAPADLERILSKSGVSSDMSADMSGAAIEPGHGQDTGGQPPEAPPIPFEQRYAKGARAAYDLAVYLVEHGYGSKKIGELLPYRAEDARATAAVAMNRTAQGEKPMHESREEAAMVRELYTTWGVPVNRLARLLDGADHENIRRVEAILGEGGVI